MQRAIVNGPLGTVGMALIRCLQGKGVETWAICRPEDSRISNIPNGVNIIECDMRNINRLKEMIPVSADAFFHLAWMGTIGPDRNDALIQTENIRCALLAVKAAKDLDCKVFVGSGSQAEHGRIEGLVQQDSPCFPQNGYGIAKLCAGQMTRLLCGQLGIRHVWARILSVYGPADGPLSVIPLMIDKLLKGEKPSLTGGEQLWDFCYSDDAAEALYAMAVYGRDGAVYPVGSGQARPLKEYFEIVRDAIDSNLPLGLGEIPYQPGQVMHLQADLTALRQDTGFAPKVSFEEGIRRTIRDYRKQLKKGSACVEEKSQHYDPML